MSPEIPSGKGGRRRCQRRVYACDTCYRKKIKCDGVLPRCDWCHHHSIVCTYTRNQDPSMRRVPQLRPRIPAADSNDEETRDIPSTAYLAASLEAVAPRVFGESIWFSGQSLGNISGFNGLPVFSASGIQWIKTCTGEDVSPDWYRPKVLSVSANRRYDSNAFASLPDIRILRHRFERHQKSIFHQLFPVVNAECFEYTIRAAYSHELSDVSPGFTGAKACILGFMALTSFLSGNPHDNAVIDADSYARDTHKLCFEAIDESATLDTLQALLMLVRAPLSTMRKGRNIDGKCNCFCSQAVSGDILRMDLLLSSAARYILHLRGNISLDSTKGDLLPAQVHVRNLFWIGFALDKLICLRTGLQPHFDITSCDLVLPETPGPSHAQHNLIAFQTLIRLCLVQFDIYRDLYCTAALQQDDAELLATIRRLDSALEEWRSTVPIFSTDPNHETAILDFLFTVQYHYCMAAIHQTSSRCTAWALNQDTRAAGSSLAISISSCRSVLHNFLKMNPHVQGHYLTFYLPELTVSTTHLFSNILMNPLDYYSEADLDLMRRSLRHVGNHIWQQAPTSFITQIRRVEKFMGNLQRLAECAIRKASRERDQR